MTGFEFLEQYEHLLHEDFKETKLVIATNSTTEYEKEAPITFTSIDQTYWKGKFDYMYPSLYR